ncbi:MAG: hypothetical protein P4L69_05965 [Desulfosporosinus sp.]|nr:hypothetical protein [Desulfosporosinus sp.]
MFIVDSNNIIIDIAADIHTDGEYIVVVKGDTFYYMAQGLTIVNQDVTDGVIPQKYLYEGGNFVLNPNYVDPNPTS